jgi:hypothetical protein
MSLSYYYEHSYKVRREKRYLTILLSFTLDKMSYLTNYSSFQNGGGATAHMIFPILWQLNATLRLFSN